MNNTKPSDDLSARQYREASQWLLRLNGDTPPESEVSAWLHWCEQDPANLKAFENIQADWQDILALRQDAAFALNHGREIGLRSENGNNADARGPISRFFRLARRWRVSEPDEESDTAIRKLTREIAKLRNPSPGTGERGARDSGKVREWTRKYPSPASGEGAESSRRMRVKYFAATATAAAAALIALGILFRGPLMEWRDSWRGQAIVADTANRTTPLTDGSILTLRAKAAVRVDFTPTERRLRLQDDGEAFFKVKHDSVRPFIVRVGNLTVQAIGTAFDVRHEANSDRIWVTVEEGVVEISSSSSFLSRDGRGTEGEDSSRNTWRAEAGYQLIYSPTQGKTRVARIDTKAATGWRKGEFAYEKIPLHQVIEDIARYSNRPIVIDDEHVRDIPYTGTVFVRSLDDWFTALSMKYPLKVVTEADGPITLKSN